MLKRAMSLMRDQRGQGMAEYGLIIALIAIAVIVAAKLLGKNIAAKFKDVGNEIGNASAVQ